MKTPFRLPHTSNARPGEAGASERTALPPRPRAEEGTGGSDMDVTATNASGWTTGV